MTIGLNVTGPNLTEENNIDDDYDNKLRFGWNFGLGCRAKLSANSAIGISALLEKRNVFIDEIGYLTGPDILQPPEMKLKYSQISLPIYFYQRLYKNLEVLSGPKFNYLVSVREYGHSFLADDFETLLIDIDFGFAYALKKKRLFLSLIYSLNISSKALYNHYIYGDFKNNAISLNLAVRMKR